MIGRALLVGSLAGALIAACGPTGPTTCEEAACVRATQVCRLFGTDTPYEPSSASCQALPNDCVENLTCDCLLAAEPETSIATCDDPAGGAALQLIVPGG